MFEKELTWIQNLELRKEVTDLLKQVPKYFQEVPASSTGKYHPAYALGSGGLYRHAQAALRIAIELFSILEFTPAEKDIILAALMLHDCWKQGAENSRPDMTARKVHTTHEHPIIAADRVNSVFKNADYARDVSAAIASHMGQWRTNAYSAVVLPLPKTAVQKFVHLCDYLASRRSIEVIL